MKFKERFYECIVLFLAFILFGQSSFAQNPIDQLKEKAQQPKTENSPSNNNSFSGSFGNNIYLEGSISGNLGEEAGQIELSPALTWQITPHLAYGAGLSLALSFGEENKAFPQYGARTYLRFAPLKAFPYLQTEYAGQVGQAGELKDIRWRNNYLAGAGYQFKMKEKGTLNFTALYQVGGDEPGMGWQFRVGVVSPLSRSVTGAEKKMEGHQPGLLDLSNFGFLDKYEVEGSIGFNTGDNNTLEFAPAINFPLVEELNWGIGPMIRFSYDDEGTTENLSYGGKIYLRYQPENNYFPFFQLEGNSISAVDSVRIKGEPAFQRNWNSAVLLGAGFTIRFNEKAGVKLSVLRDLTFQDANAVRSTPWDFRIGMASQLGNNSKRKKSSSKVNPPQWKNRLTLSGNLSANLGNTQSIDITPLIGYEWEHLHISLGPSYQYQKEMEKLGVRSQMQVVPKKGWPYLQAEYETLKIQRNNSKADLPVHWQQSGLLGAGYAYSVSGCNRATLAFMYPVYSSSIQPKEWVIRGGITVPLGNNCKQEKKPTSTSRTNALKEKLEKTFTVEGNVGFSFGETTQIDFSPLLGYKIAEPWTVGVGPSFQFTRNSSDSTSTTNYGGRVFTRFEPSLTKRQKAKNTVWKWPYLQAEGELLNSQNGEMDSQQKFIRQWYASALAGAGYRFPIGKSTSFNVTVLYNLSWIEATPLHGSPWVVRAGFQF